MRKAPLDGQALEAYDNRPCAAHLASPTYEHASTSLVVPVAAKQFCSGRRGALGPALGQLLSSTQQSRRRRPEANLPPQHSPNLSAATQQARYKDAAAELRHDDQ